MPLLLVLGCLCALQYCKHYNVTQSVVDLLNEVPSVQLVKYGFHNLISVAEGKHHLVYGTVALGKLLIFLARFHINVVVVNAIPEVGEEPLDFDLDECFVLRDALEELNAIVGGEDRNCKDVKTLQRYASLNANVFLKEVQKDLDSARLTMMKGTQKLVNLEGKLSAFFKAHKTKTVDRPLHTAVAKQTITTEIV
jgi:hypothetical protein